jgi:hypothetical protein
VTAGKVPAIISTAYSQTEPVAIWNGLALVGKVVAHSGWARHRKTGSALTSLPVLYAVVSSTCRGRSRIVMIHSGRNEDDGISRMCCGTCTIQHPPRGHQGGRDVANRQGRPIFRWCRGMSLHKCRGNCVADAQDASGRSSEGSKRRRSNGLLQSASFSVSSPVDK